MKVEELIAKLEDNKLKFKGKVNLKQTALYYSEEKRGNKFLEIHADKDKNVTRVIFHQNAILPTSIISNIEDSGDDDRINRRLSYNNNDEDIISVAVASYSKVREERLLKDKNNRSV